MPGPGNRLGPKARAWLCRVNEYQPLDARWHLGWQAAESGNDRDLLDKHLAESSALGRDRVAPGKQPDGHRRTETKWPPRDRRGDVPILV